MLETAALRHLSALVPRDGQAVQPAVGPAAAGRRFAVRVVGHSVAVLPVVLTAAADVVAAVGEQQSVIGWRGFGFRRTEKKRKPTR